MALAAAAADRTTGWHDPVHDIAGQQRSHNFLAAALRHGAAGGRETYDTARPPLLKKPQQQPERGACATWNCSCQAFSDTFNTKASIGNFGRAMDKPEARRWWLVHSCDTDPTVPSRLARPTLTRFSAGYHNTEMRTTLALSAYTTSGCLATIDNGWDIVLPLNPGPARFRSTTVSLPWMLPMQPWLEEPGLKRRERLVGGRPPLRGMRPAPVLFVPANSSDRTVASPPEGSCLDPESSRVKNISSASALTLLYNPGRDGKCSVVAGTTDSAVAEQAAKCDADPAGRADKGTVMLAAHGSELMVGIYHTLINKYQMFSLVLEVLQGPKQRLAALLDTRPSGDGREEDGDGGDGDAVAPLSRKPLAPVALRRLIFYGGPWGGGLPSMTERVMAAMQRVLKKDYAIDLEFVRPQAPMRQPRGGTLWLMNTEEIGGACADGPCAWFARPAHAARLRREMFPTALPAIKLHDHAEVLVLNRAAKFARHIIHADGVLSRLAAKLAAQGYHTGTRLVPDAGDLGNEQPDVAYNHSVIITPHGQTAAGSFMFAPECAIIIELFSPGGFNHMYGGAAITSGHIYGYNDFDIILGSASPRPLPSKSPLSPCHILLTPSR